MIKKRFSFLNILLLFSFILIINIHITFAALSEEGEEFEDTVDFEEIYDPQTGDFDPTGTPNVPETFRDGILTLSSSGSFTYNGDTYSGDEGDTFEISGGILTQVTTSGGSGTDNNNMAFEGIVEADFSVSSSNYYRASQVTQNGNIFRDIINAVFFSSGDYEIESASYLKQSSTEIINPKNITYNSATNTLKIEQADSMIIENRDILTDVKKFEINLDEFQVSSAESLRIACGVNAEYIYIENVTSSTFRVNGIVKITADSNVNYDIEDCSGSMVNFQAKKNDNLTLTKNTTRTQYLTQGGNITVGPEFLTTNTSAYVEIDPNLGFVCMTLGIGSEHRNDDLDYLVIEPMDGDFYKLCLKKRRDQEFPFIYENNCTNCGLLDFKDEENILKGRIIFKRKISDYYWLNVFDSFVSQINFKGISYLKDVAIDKQNEKDIYAFIMPTNYYLLKEENGFGYINKYDWLFDSETSSLISVYRVIPDNAFIKIKDDVMNINNRIRIYPKNSIPVKVFLHG